MAARSHKHRLSYRLWRGCLYLIAVAVAALAVAPLVIAVGTAVKIPGTATSDLSIFPEHPDWANFPAVVTGTSLLTYVRNSIIVTAATVAGSLVCASLAAYAFSRMNFFMKKTFYLIILMGLTYYLQLNGRGRCVKGKE